MLAGESSSWREGFSTRRISSEFDIGTRADSALVRHHISDESAVLRKSGLETRMELYRDDIYANEV